MPRSNNNCPICIGRLRKKIDAMLARGEPVKDILKEVNAKVPFEDKEQYIEKPMLLLHNERHRQWSDNQAFGQPQLYAGDVISRTNFEQLEPRTPVGEGVPKITLKKCNVLNCLFLKGTALEQCYEMQVSFCSHLHPELVKRGLSECKVDCKHCVESIPEVIIEGRVVAKDVRQYRDKVVK